MSKDMEFVIGGSTLGHSDKAEFLREKLNQWEDGRLDQTHNAAKALGTSAKTLQLLLFDETLKTENSVRTTYHHTGPRRIARLWGNKKTIAAWRKKHADLVRE